MKIIFSADGRKAETNTGGQPLTAGSVGIDAVFVLSADYDGLTVTAVFRTENKSVEVLLSGNTCKVPWEVLTEAGYFLYIGVLGKNGSGQIVIPTVWAKAGIVECGTVASGIDPQDPTPDIAAQLLQIAQETVERAETAETGAEAAKTAAEAAQAAAEEAAPFYAVYGQTTKEEIAAAKNGKRQIFLQTTPFGGTIVPYTGSFSYVDPWDEGTGYRFMLTEGTAQHVYELTNSWSSSINDLEAPAQRAETAAAEAESSATAAEGSATAAGNAQAGAEAAKQAIEDMGVTAHEDPAGPSVEKTVDPDTGAVTLDFGFKPAGVTEVNGQTGAVSLDLDDIPDGAQYVRTTTAQVRQIGTNKDDIADIEAKIPPQASATNQLTDKDFVNSSINSSAAFFRGAFPTRTALFAVAWQTSDPTDANYVSNNDYAYVADDETHNDEAWRYIYVLQPGGTGNGWQPQFKVNDSPLTAAQLAALNSGATAEIIASIAEKYELPADGIPKADLAAGVQQSLDKAATALQPEALEPYRTAAAQDVIDAAQDEKIAAAAQATETSTIGPEAIATFDASAADMPLKGLTVDIEPVQDLHRYDHPWPAGGGVNKLKPISAKSTTNNGVTITSNGDGIYSVSGTVSSGTAAVSISFDTPTLIKAGTYYMSVLNDSTPSVTVGFYMFANATRVWDIVLNATNKQAMVTVPADIYGTTLQIYVASAGTVNFTLSPVLSIDGYASTFSPYSNICPITGWTGCKLHRTGVSLIGGDAFIGNTFSKTASGYQLSYNGSSIANRASGNADIRGIPAGRYTIAMLNPSYPDGVEVNIRRRTAGSAVAMGLIIGGPYAFGRRTYDIPENTTALQLYIIPNTMSLNSSITMSDIVLVREADNDFPEPYKGNTYNITFPTEAGTVYGGTLDVVNKKLTLEWERVVISDVNWTLVSGTADGVYIYSCNNLLDRKFGTNDDGIYGLSNSYDFFGNGSRTNIIAELSDGQFGFQFTNAIILLRDDRSANAQEFKDNNQSADLVYPLATPIVYDLTPTQIATLLGTNNIWADCGDVTVTYGAYLETIKAHADRLGDSILSAIAPLETTYTASRAYTVGSYLFVGTKFYKVTQAIAEGGTITPGTNVTQTTVAEQLVTLAAN